MTGDSLKKEVTNVLNELVTNTQGGPPGAVFAAVDKTGKILTSACAGYSNSETKEPISEDSVFHLWSTTKIIATMACLQLVEQGKLSLDEPISKVLPELGNVRVFLPDGSTEPIKKPITLRHLLSHTSGFSYSFFNTNVYEWCKKNDYDEFGGRLNGLVRPLAFQPGEKWEYGVGVDLAGQALEKVTGKTLGEYCSENIFKPLGVPDLSFDVSSEAKKKLVTLHKATEDGKFVPREYFAMTSSREFDSAGAGLYGRISDYLQCIVPLLNEGKGANGHQILKAETINDLIFKPQTSHIKNCMGGPFDGPQPHLSPPSDFSPLGPVDYSLGLCITHGPMPSGRSPDSGYWCGLANLHYSVDRTNGVATMIACQVLPFANPNVIGAWFQAEGLVLKSIGKA